MNVMDYILIGVIVLVVAIDLYVKNKNKKSDSTNVNFPLKKEKSNNVLIISIGSLLVVLVVGFFVADKFYYDGRLTNNEDQFSIIEIIKYNKLNKTHCNGRLFDNDGLNINDKITLTYFDYNNVELIGDSLYKHIDSISYLNGILYCDYGNIGKVNNGNPDGLFTLYHANGQKKMQVKLNNGKQEGLREDWYSNGQKEFEGFFDNDKQSGVSKFWYSNGQIELEAVFENGKFSGGDYKRWYNDGSVKYIYNHNDKTYKEYWDTGEIYCDAHSVQSPSSPLENHFSNEVKVQANFFSKDGKLINKIPHTRLTKAYKYDYRDLNGGPCTGDINCVFYQYYLNGDVMDMQYDNYNNISIWKTFYENGKLFRYFKGDDWTFYKRNGKIASKSNNIKRIFKNYIDGEFAYDLLQNKGGKLFSKRRELFY